MDSSGFFDYPTVELDERAAEVIFLADRNADDWRKLLAHTDVRRFRAGEVVLRAGDRERALYLLTEGTLEVILPERRDRGSRFKSIAAPSVIGEVAFLDGEPRSLSLRAATDGEAHRLSLEAFEVLAAREPELARAILFDLARILSRRQRTTTSFIAEWVT